jgi:hypothetical protein
MKTEFLINQGCWWISRGKATPCTIVAFNHIVCKIKTKDGQIFGRMGLDRDSVTIYHDAIATTKDEALRKVGIELVLAEGRAIEWRETKLELEG